MERGTSPANISYVNRYADNALRRTDDKFYKLLLTQTTKCGKIDQEGAE